MTIDPVRITDYNRTERELQELLLFCIAVAGKNATHTSRRLDRFLRWCCQASGKRDYFSAIRHLDQDHDLTLKMKLYGFGCYNLKSRGFVAAATSDLDLRTCSTEELERIPGIGRKTSRFFILHSRQNANYACLDTHILKWLAYYTGYENVPKQTPSSKRQYEYWERVFLDIAAAMNIAPAILDLKIWNKQRGSDEESQLRAKSSRQGVFDAQESLAQTTRAKKPKGLDSRVHKTRPIHP